MNSQNLDLNYLIVDDHPLYRKGVVSIIKSINIKNTCFEASNGFEAIHLFRKIKTDIIFLDIQMPKMDGIVCLKHLRKIDPDCKVVIISSSDSPLYVLQLMNQNVNAYLLKNINSEILKQAINNVICGDPFLSPEIYKQWFDIKHLNNKYHSKIIISEREKEILRLICESNSSKEISDKLNISFSTVKTHRNHLMKKTEAKNIADLIIYAIKNEIYFIDNN